MSYLLPLLVLIPLAGSAGLALGFRGEPARASRWATAVAGFAFLLAIILATRFSTAAPLREGPIQPRLAWASPPVALTFLGSTAPSIRFELGLDGLGIGMILLTTAVTLAILIVVPRQIRDRKADYALSILLAEAMLLGAFLSMDLLSFYIFFELTLLPILAMMLGWGTGESRTAALRFVLFTLAGSLPMLAGLTLVATLSPSDISQLTISLPELSTRLASGDSAVSLAWQSADIQRVAFVLILLGLGIKMAILPLHTWVPSTYLSAHPTTAALLAAVVLKLGVFGMFRLLLPILPGPTAEFGASWGPALGAIAVVYGSLVALAQNDLRLLLAYGSLAHVGFITMGLFSLTQEGLAGAAMQMINHGVTTAAMFLALGMMAIRRHSYDWSIALAGLVSAFPLLSLLFIFFTLAGAGMPGLNNFVGEVLSLSGMVQRSLFWTAVASLGIIFGAWYSLRVVQRLLFGPPSEMPAPAGGERRDLRRSEWACLLPLAAACLLLGVVPARAIRTIDQDTTAIARLYGGTTSHGSTVAQSADPDPSSRSVRDDD
jgi:NADH-quinone oxidoreductase subunit M